MLPLFWPFQQDAVLAHINLWKMNIKINIKRNSFGKKKQGAAASLAAPKDDKLHLASRAYLKLKVLIMRP